MNRSTVLAVAVQNLGGTMGKRFSGYRALLLFGPEWRPTRLSPFRSQSQSLFCSQGPPAPAPSPTLHFSSIVLFDIAFAVDVNAPPCCRCKSKRSFPAAGARSSFRCKLVACPNQAPSVDRALSSVAVQTLLCTLRLISQQWFVVWAVARSVVRIAVVCCIQASAVW